jgi:hypothetical protein
MVIIISFKNGGRGGIRTHGPFRAYSFQDCRNRPLYHSSLNFGAPNRIRTDSYDTPFERAAFTNLAIGACKLDPQQFLTLYHLVAYSS